MNPEQGLMRADDLVGPSISGTVQVPLIELDQMRSQHAAAVRMAKELEAKQPLVKVILGKMEPKKIWDDYHGRYRTTGEQGWVQTGVEYKNFEEFREVISKEERAKVQQFVDELRTSANDAIKAKNTAQKHADERIREADDILFKSKKLTEEVFAKTKAEIEEIKALQPELNKKYAEAQEELEELKESIQDREKEVEILRDDKTFLSNLLDIRDHELTKLRIELRDWKIKKSLWYWFQMKWREKENKVRELQ